MKTPLDKFSNQSQTYKKYRPTYPQELYDIILAHTVARNKCWDCGTGNGQVASHLANYFEKVYATDLSQNQIANAIQKENIQYAVERAEQTYFEDDQFDLITVGQAIHWFDFEAFNKEVKRVAKHKATLAVWGYSLLRISPELDPLIDHFCNNTVGPFWNKERRYIDEEYETVQLDFEESKIEHNLSIRAKWQIEHLDGFLNSWSSVQNYKREKGGENPVNTLMEEVKRIWPSGESKEVRFPMFLRLGKIKKLRV